MILRAEQSDTQLKKLNKILDKKYKTNTILASNIDFLKESHLVIKNYILFYL